MGGVKSALPPPDTPWAAALTAAAVFAVDPAGLTGVAVKARIGPVRDAWLARLRDLLPVDAPVRRLPPSISDSRLLGGLDLAATLRAGRPIAERGVLADADGGVVVVPMAEKLESGMVARIGMVLDSGAVRVERDGLALEFGSRFGVVALDESIAEDEHAHPALLDRLAFLVDLGPVGPRDLEEDGLTRAGVGRARDRLGLIRHGEPALKALCATAAALGIASARASLLALRAARAIAALRGHAEIQPNDTALAARLVLAPRATAIPAPEEAEPGQPEPEEAEAAANADERPDAPPPADERDGADGSPSADEGADRSIDDLVLAAAAAAIPPGLLARLTSAAPERSRSSTMGKAGAARIAIRGGRPVGFRKGEPTNGARLNLIETLRAAAPWQRLRRDAAGRDGEQRRRIEIRKDDFRVPRLKHRSLTTTIFVVDASGSSALNRLAEAKGAVELLLAECYVRRDKVALVAFRGRGAEILLPPTRSLVRAKRSLANLPGGGGTPLADGIRAAANLADGVRRQGETPVVVLMTDGRANIARRGVAGRAEAEADAFAAARALRSAGLAALLIDTSPRTQPLAGRLAAEMGATYLPLPSADAAALSRGVQAAQGRSGAGRRA